MYEGAITSPFNKLKNVLSSCLSHNGKVITFGYHSVSMGAKRGFTVEEICVMSHGGAIHDTIATVERRLNNKEKGQCASTALSRHRQTPRFQLTNA